MKVVVFDILEVDNDADDGSKFDVDGNGSSLIMCCFSYSFIELILRTDFFLLIFLFAYFRLCSLSISLIE